MRKLWRPSNRVNWTTFRNLRKAEKVALGKASTFYMVMRGGHAFKMEYVDLLEEGNKRRKFQYHRCSRCATVNRVKFKVTEFGAQYLCRDCRISLGLLKNEVYRGGHIQK